MKMELWVGPGLVALLGAFVYALAANPKAAELARIAFFCGLLALLLTVGHLG